MAVSPVIIKRKAAQQKSHGANGQKNGASELVEVMLTMNITSAVRHYHYKYIHEKYTANCI
jgi:hypothetical protein